MTMVSMLIFESRPDESTYPIAFLPRVALPLGMPNPTNILRRTAARRESAFWGPVCSVVFMAHAGSFICSAGRSTEPPLTHK